MRLLTSAFAAITLIVVARVPYDGRRKQTPRSGYRRSIADLSDRDEAVSKFILSCGARSSPGLRALSAIAFLRVFTAEEPTVNLRAFADRNFAVEAARASRHFALCQDRTWVRRAFAPGPTGCICRLRRRTRCADSC